MNNIFAGGKIEPRKVNIYLDSSPKKNLSSNRKLKIRKELKKMLNKRKRSKRLIQNKKKGDNSGKNYQNSKNSIVLKKILSKHSVFFGLKILKNKNCLKIN